MVKNRTIEGLMMKKTNFQEYWSMKDVYEDRIGAAHHFIAEYESNWRQYVQSIS
jgi:hypothetical protein